MCFLSGSLLGSAVAVICIPLSCCPVARVSPPLINGRGRAGQWRGAYVRTHAESGRSPLGPLRWIRLPKIRGNYTELWQMAINHDAPDTAEMPQRTPLESLNPDFALDYLFIFFSRRENIFFSPKESYCCICRHSGLEAVVKGTLSVPQCCNMAIGFHCDGVTGVFLSFLFFLCCISQSM